MPSRRTGISKNISLTKYSSAQSSHQYQVLQGSGHSKFNRYSVPVLPTGIQGFQQMEATPFSILRDF